MNSSPPPGACPIVERLRDAERALQVRVGKDIPLLIRAEQTRVEDDMTDILDRLVQPHGNQTQGQVVETAHAVGPAGEVQQQDSIRAEEHGALLVYQAVNDRMIQEFLGNLNKRFFFHDFER